MTVSEGPKEVSEDIRKRLEDGLSNLAQADSESRKRFETARVKWAQALKPIEDAIAASERLTAEDFSIRINTRD
jgi:hypothetical protein